MTACMRGVCVVCVVSLARCGRKMIGGLDSSWKDSTEYTNRRVVCSSARSATCTEVQWVTGLGCGSSVCCGPRQDPLSRARVALHSPVSDLYTEAVLLNAQDCPPHLFVLLVAFDPFRKIEAPAGYWHLGYAVLDDCAVTVVTITDVCSTLVPSGISLALALAPL